MNRVIALLLVSTWSAALAVTPAEWKDNTEAAFSTGEFASTAVSSLGEVRLSRATQLLAGPDVAPAVVSALTTSEGVVYLASGTDNKVYRYENEELSLLAETPGAMVNCMLVVGKDVLVGAGGRKAGLYHVNAQGKVTPIWTDDDVTYVWDVAAGPDGTLYVATGGKAKVYAIADGGKARVIYEADEKLARNILCLAVADGNVYAGTDTSGLVIEIDPKAPRGRVILDAAEQEISALLSDGAGGLYAATSDAAKASDDGDAEPSAARSGKAAPVVEDEAPVAPPEDPAPNPPADEPTDESPDGPAPTCDEDRPSAATESAALSRQAKHRRSSDAPDVPGKVAPAAAARTSTRPATAPAIAAPAAPTQAAAGPATAPSAARPLRPTAARAASPTASGTGNAVYHIGAGGLVQTVFRQPVTIFAMIRQDDRLLLGTGNGGDIYSVSLDGDEIVRVADTDAGQVTALAIDPEGGVLFGTSNKGSLARLTAAAAEEGTFTSQVKDAQQVAQWGTIRVDAATPAGARLGVSTRSGNVAEPGDATWSAWSDEAPVPDGFLKICSPNARYLQYRLRLVGDKQGPTVREVGVVYQVGNLPPRVTALQVAASEKGAQQNITTGGPLAFRHVQIKAADANNDRLTFTIAYRQVGGPTWITLRENHPAATFVWDTRTAPDGRYELRVTASDAPSNPPGTDRSAARISEPFEVDNTAPAIEPLTARLDGGTVIVEGTARDAATRIVALAYAVSSAEEWTVALPTDGICDSAKEPLRLEIKNLAKGAHRITVRAADTLGNIGYASVDITVK